MKVSEAKEKICPFMSTDNPNVTEWTRCQCDDCMAWEWEYFMYDPALLNNRDSLIEMCKNRKISFQNNDSSEKLTAKLFSYENREGYCKRLKND